MQFALSDDQRELREGAREYLRAALPLERVGEKWDPASWRELAELGWLGATVPEEQGGAGLGFVEQAILLEELGYGLYSGPYLVTVLALPELGPEQQAAVAAGKTRWSVEVDGLVPELDRVDWVATANGAAAAEGETLDSIDPTRPLGRLSEGAREHLPGALDSSHVLTALAAEALGVARRAHEIAVEYAKERQQFGKRIGVYQAIAHPLADSFGDIELAGAPSCGRPRGSSASSPRRRRLPRRPRRPSPRRRRSRRASGRSRCLGGIGFTWEHPSTTSGSGHSGCRRSPAIRQCTGRQSRGGCWSRSALTVYRTVRICTNTKTAAAAVAPKKAPSTQ